MNLERLGGRRAALDPENPIVIMPVPKGAGFKDGFVPVINKTLDEWQYMLAELSKARTDMHEAAFHAIVMFQKNDASGRECKGYLGFDAKTDKSPPCEELLIDAANNLDVIIANIYDANKAAMFSMGGKR